MYCKYMYLQYTVQNILKTCVLNMWYKFKYNNKEYLNMYQNDKTTNCYNWLF